MPTLIETKAQMRALATRALAVVDDPSLTISQKKAGLDQVEPELKRLQLEHDSLEQIELQRRSLFTLAGDTGSLVPDELAGARVRRPLTGLAAGVAAKGYRPVGAPQLDLSPEQTAELYAAVQSHKSYSLVTKAADDSTSITPAGILDVRPTPVTALREPTRVLSLLPTFATDHSTVEWFTTTGTTAAAAVAEGATKPQSHIAYTAQTTSATKLAHYVEATDETFSDFPAFLGVLQNDMMDGLVKAENAEVLNASVTGAHKWPGLLNVSGIQVRDSTTFSTDNAMDAISRAFDDLRTGTSFTEPDGVVMHPTTWGAMTRIKTSTGAYYLRPEPARAGAAQLWGVPVVLTTQIAAGTALVGSFAESVIAYIREGMRVETANEGTAQFTNNTTLVRCEERLILTVPRPTGLCKVTGLLAA